MPRVKVLGFGRVKSTNSRFGTDLCPFEILGGNMPFYHFALKAKPGVRVTLYCPGDGTLQTNFRRLLALAPIQFWEIDYGSPLKHFDAIDDLKNACDLKGRVTGKVSLVCKTVNEYRVDEPDVGR